MPTNKNNKAVDTSKSSRKKTNEKNNQEYIVQKFGPKAVALIHKFRLQTNPPFSKLINTYQGIHELGKKNPRYKELTKMWESEFNFLFERFWKDYQSSNNKNNTSIIAGWKERLDINQKTFGSSMEDKKELFMHKIQPAFTNEDRSYTKKEIMKRAGYKEGSHLRNISFTAESKTKNLNELENIINEEYHLERTSDFENHEPFKAIKKQNPEKSFDDIKVDTKPDPALSDFLNEQFKNISKYKDETEIEYTSGDVDEEILSKYEYQDEVKEPVSNEIPRITDLYEPADMTIEEYELKVQQAMELNDSILDEDSISKSSSIRELIFGDNKSTDSSSDFLNSVGKVEVIPKAKFDTEEEDLSEDLSPEFYRKEFQKIYDQQSEIILPKTSENNYEFMSNDNYDIDPSKRNILSKEDFVYEEKEKEFSVSNFTLENKNPSSTNRPFHEIKPVGVYDMVYDPEKRPSTIQNMYYENIENEMDDELQRKIKILRELKDQRRHRINMLRIEKSNSSVIARAIEFRNKRELRMERKKNVENVKVIERMEKLRRLQERQRLVNLLKQRQLKLEEEKRIAQQIKFERQRNIEREAQYRMDLASIEAQIHREMELIKDIEMKTKAQYMKNHESDIPFDESMKKSYDTKFNGLIDSIEKDDKSKLEKNKEKIEQIALNFKKNL